MTLTEVEIHAETHNMDFVYYNKIPQNAPGLSHKYDMSVDQYLILLNRALLKCSDRVQKLLLAHEIGHCTKDLFSFPFNYRVSWAWCEYRAWKEAVFILIPEDELDKAVYQGMLEVWELAEHFDVPCIFMEFAIRYYRHLPFESTWALVDSRTYT